MRSGLTHKSVVSLIVIILLSTPLLRAQALTLKEEQYIADSLVKLGASMGNFGYTMLKNGQSVKKPLVNGDREALQKMVNGYKNGVEAGRGTIGLLDTTLEIAITGTEIYTAGAGLIATAGVRYAKNKGLEYVMDKIEDDQRKFLAANLQAFESKSGLDFDVLSKKKPAEIAAALNKVDEFKMMKDQLIDDPKARALFENAMIDTVKNSVKANLLETAKNTGDINELKKQMVSTNRKLVNFVDRTNTALSGLSAQLTQTQKDIDSANRTISQLVKDTSKNTQQLEVLTELTFDKSSAEDRLKILNGSEFLKGRLSESDRSALVKSLEAQATKEKLVAQMGNIVNDFSKISKIADNIGLPLPDEINQAITFADTATKAVSSIMSGDYLGAIVGITGLFGPPRPDPNAVRHEQLMNFLKQNFSEINEKLDRIIDGQQKIMEGLVALSNQAAEYDRALHERLDRIEYQLDTIQSIVRDNLYSQKGVCGVTQKDTINFIRDKDPNSIPSDTTKTQNILGLSPGISTGVRSCSEYLRALFYSTFDPDKLGTNPLSMRYSIDAGDTGIFVISKDVQKKYSDDLQVKKFLDYQYKPQSIFYLSQTKSIRLNKSEAVSLKAHETLAVSALPTRNLDSLNKKLRNFGINSKACSKGTVLSNPLLDLLCSEKDKATPTRLDIPVDSSDDSENKADERSHKLINNALAHDDITTLSNWALFYAPLYDIYDFKDNRIPANQNKLMKLLSDESYGKNKPNGQLLLEGAFRVVTVSLAQVNMLYGDVTAKLVFQNLWDFDNKKFLAEPVIPDECKSGAENNCAFPKLNAQQQAFLIFKSNPYIQQNVLMLALNETAQPKGSGEPIAYEAALDWMEKGSVNSDGQLRASFGDGWNFKNIVKDELNRNGAKAKINYPAVSIYGVDLQLPSVRQFSTREFTYPMTLRRLLASRDLLANRIADYEVIEWAAKNSSNPQQSRKDLVETLVKLSN